MNAITLVIGNRNYSSWSLRAWLVLRKSGLPHEECRLSLFAPEFDAAIGNYSPSGKVPAILVDGHSIWDSLAVSEFVNELVEDRLWPRDSMARAHARSLVAEMHSGFDHLRAGMPMNCRAKGRRVKIGEDIQGDVERVQAVWHDAKRRFGEGGAWLYGDFSIADAFYAPVVSRFETYGVEVDTLARDYMDTVLKDHDVAAWYQMAAEESEVLEEEEVGV